MRCQNDDEITEIQAILRRAKPVRPKRFDIRKYIGQALTRLVCRIDWEKARQ
jgi:hypothetical protein